MVFLVLGAATTGAVLGIRGLHQHRSAGERAAGPGDRAARPAPVSMGGQDIRLAAPGSQPPSASNGAGVRDEETETETDREASEPAALAQTSTASLLRLAVTSIDRWLKADVIEELAARRAGDALPLVMDLLGDPDAGVRQAAAEALAELATAETVPAVRRRLQDERHPAVRRALAEALEDWREP